MLIILSTHPIQYQVPLWQALARDGRLPFEVWYMSDHATKVSPDKEFGKNFAWDLDMLSGYPYQFLKVPSNASPASFWKCRLNERLRNRLAARKAKVLWIQGWQVAGYWQAVNEASKAGVEIWLRGESNDLAPLPHMSKRLIKRLLLGWMFRRVSKFLCIGRANKRLYQSYGVQSERLLDAPYCVDNARFSRQAENLLESRMEIRRQWNIADNAVCLLFCGKFIDKKRPQDLIKAAVELNRQKKESVHLLFVGSGELGEQLRSMCQVVYDSESKNTNTATEKEINFRPLASFAGFLNQTKISEAYVAADCLVLPSDFGETWGLVVNEAMASGLPCVISDRCGSAEDLGARNGNQTFRFGVIDDLVCSLIDACERRGFFKALCEPLNNYSIDACVDTVITNYTEKKTVGRS